MTKSKIFCPKYNFSLQKERVYDKIILIVIEKEIPMPNEEKKRASETVCAQSPQAMKKRILIIGAAVLATLIVLFGVLWLVDWLANRNAGVPDGTYEFYPPYNGDIMENEEYLALNRMVDYCDDPLGYGLKQSITDENIEEFDATVLFLRDYLQTVIAGDAETYNSYFNHTYFEDNEPQNAFYQQMLYNMVIYYESTEKQDGGDTLTTYRLEYMIYKNNGSFHRDVGSDAILPRHVTLRIGADGTISIERIMTSYAK